MKKTARAAAPQRRITHSGSGAYSWDIGDVRFIQFWPRIASPRSLETMVPEYKRAIIVIHGTSRNADKYFSSVVKLAQAAPWGGHRTGSAECVLWHCLGRSDSCVRRLGRQQIPNLFPER